MTEIRTYAASNNIKPTTVLQKAGNLSGKVWEAWIHGASCTVPTADNIRNYMRNNPAPE